MSARIALAQAVSRQPRLSVASLPTPLTHAPRFSVAVGGEVWIKRDDLTGLALGGNKARKIEFIMGAATARGEVDNVVTVGAPQSNHARTVAAAARLAGWDCHLVLSGDRPSRPTGNLVLDVALGAELHFAGTHDWSELESAAVNLTKELSTTGRRVLTIPMGGSTPIGAIGFVAAYLELLDQVDELGIAEATIVHATATGGTQGGLDYAHRVVGSGPDVIGVGVAKTQTDLTADIVKLEGELAGVLGLDPGTVAPTVLPGYLGAGYAIPTDGGQAALHLLAESEAILTDPVYSAKALHAVSDLARDGRGPLIFWHTGGIPALFSDEAGVSAWP